MGQKFVAAALLLVFSLGSVSCGGTANPSAFWHIAATGQFQFANDRTKEHVILVVLPVQPERGWAASQVMPFWKSLSAHFRVANENAISVLEGMSQRDSLERMRFAAWTLFQTEHEGENSRIEEEDVVAWLRSAMQLTVSPSVQPAVSLDQQLTDNSLAALSVIVGPQFRSGNLCSSQDAACATGYASDPDAFLSRKIGKLLNSQGFLKNNFVLVTSGDETIVISDMTEEPSQAGGTQNAASGLGYASFPGVQSIEGSSMLAESPNGVITNIDSSSGSVGQNSGRSGTSSGQDLAASSVGASGASIARGTDWGTPGPIGTKTPNIASFTTTSVRSLNSIRFADQFQNIEEAGADCGSDTCVVIIPPSYSGTDCAISYRPNVTYIDYRGTTLCLLNSTTYNYLTPGNTRSMIRHQMRVTGPLKTGGGTVALYSVTEARDAKADGTQVVDGFAADSQSTGSLSGDLGYLTGGEFAAVGLSTGGSVKLADGVQGYFTNSSQSTTQIAEVRGVDGVGCGEIVGTQPKSCYGLYGRYQTGASSRNYSIGLDGLGLLLYNGSFKAAGLDAEDASHYAHRFLYIANDNTTNVQAVSASGTNMEDSSGKTRLHLDSNGVEAVGDARISGISALEGGFRAGRNGSTIRDSRLLAQFAAAVSTSAGTSDTVAIPGVTASSHCSLTPTNLSAATNIESSYISAKQEGMITVTHAPTPGMTYDILCTAD